MDRKAVRARLPIYKEMYHNGREISAQLIEDLGNCLDTLDELEELVEKFVASLSPGDQARIEAAIERQG